MQSFWKSYLPRISRIIEFIKSERAGVARWKRDITFNEYGGILTREAFREIAQNWQYFCENCLGDKERRKLTAFTCKGCNTNGGKPTVHSFLIDTTKGRNFILFKPRRVTFLSFEMYSYGLFYIPEVSFMNYTEWFAATRAANGKRILNPFSRV